jgi:hypothetical protein
MGSARMLTAGLASMLALVMMGTSPVHAQEVQPAPTLAPTVEDQKAEDIAPTPSTWKVAFSAVAVVPGLRDLHRTHVALEELVGDPRPHRQRHFTPSCTTRPSSALVIWPNVGVPRLRPGFPSRS